MRRLIGLGMGVLLMSAAVAICGEETQARSDGDPVLLFPIVKGGKWGYMDETGAVKIEPKKYDLAFDFREGLACVAVGPLRGYIDKTGEEVIKPQFGWCGPFSEGYTYACIKPKIFGSDMVDFYKGSLNWAMIDREGKPQKNWGFSFGRNTEGFREGKVVGQRNVCYDKDGKKLQHDADELFPFFSERLIPARKGAKWGYLDHSMKWVVEPQFDAADRFSEGLAAVGKSDAPADTKARSRGAPPCKWGFIDKEGKVVIELNHEEVWHFSEGLAPVRAGDKASGKWGYLDKNGGMSVEPAYDYAWPFSEGMGRILVGDKQGFIDKSGVIAIKPKYTPAWEFSKGLARVGTEDDEGYKEGYIDKKGKYVWEPTK